MLNAAGKKVRALVIGLLGLLAIAYAGQQTMGSCTLGVHNTSATLAISGWGHNSECRRILTMNHVSLFEDVTRDPPVGDFVCAKWRRLHHYVVRDRGLPAFAMGNGICEMIQNPDFFDWSSSEPSTSFR